MFHRVCLDLVLRSLEFCKDSVFVLFGNDRSGASLSGYLAQLRIVAAGGRFSPQQSRLFRWEGCVVIGRLSESTSGSDLSSLSCVIDWICSAVIVQVCEV